MFAEVLSLLGGREDAKRRFPSQDTGYAYLLKSFIVLQTHKSFVSFKYNSSELSGRVVSNEDPLSLSNP